MNLLKLRDLSSSASVIVTPPDYSPASQQLRQTRGLWLVLILLFTLQGGLGGGCPKALGGGW